MASPAVSDLTELAGLLPSLDGGAGRACAPALARIEPVPTEVHAVVRRRPTPAQGRALEVLGHAIEYLVDSRMFLQVPSGRAADQLAARLLMQASRSVFAECDEVVPMRHRLKLWVQAPFTRRIS